MPFGLANAPSVFRRTINTHSFELETLAVVCALDRFRVNVLGKTFKVITDCSAICSTMSKRALIPRIARWYIVMQEYDLIVEHRNSERMAHVDALSRNSISEEKCSEIRDIRDIMLLDENTWLETVQSQDSEVQRTISILKDLNTKDRSS